MPDQRRQEPAHRVVNGKKIYTVGTITNSWMRDRPPEAHRVGAAHSVQGSPGAEGEAGESDPEGRTTNSGSDPPGVVRKQIRFLSAVHAWPSMGWFGAQLVDYGHDNARALRQLPDLINGRGAHPVPFMWDHSYSSKDRMGKIVDAAWEDSTDIPPGVNVDGVVNRQYDEKAAVGLETGEIDATSASVVFDMERSHPDMKFSQFLELQGHEVDGEVVRWLPVAAIAVHHHAAVWAGADPHSGPRAADGEDRKSEGTRAPVGAVHNEETSVPAQNEDTAGLGGGSGMAEKLIAILTAACGVLGIDVFLSATSDPPEGLQERITNKLDGLVKAQEAYNKLASGLQALMKFCLAEGESTLTAAQVLERLPGRLELAKHGEQYIEDLRADALKWFRLAKMEKDKQELSADAKQIESVIEACSDIGQLRAYQAEYRPQAEARFGHKPGSHRTSAGEELPGETTAEMDASSRKVGASYDRYYKEGD